MLCEKSGLGEEKLAHRIFLPGIAYAKVKTDPVDAHALARLLRPGFIPKAFVAEVVAFSVMEEHEA